MSVKAPDGGGSGEDAVMAQLAAGLGGSVGTAAGRVYMGMGSVLPTTGQNPDYLSPAAQASLSRRQIWMSLDDALGDFYTWKPKKQDDFLAKLKVSGMVSEDAGPMEAGKVWSALVQEAANYGAQGKQVSPFDLLSRYVKTAGKTAWDTQGVFEVNRVTGERRYKGPGIYLGNGQAITSSSSIDLTDPASARAVAEKMFQDLMGRNPGKGEIAQFASALTSAEQANPVNESTTTQYDMTTGQAISSSSTRSGGVDADAKAMLASDQIKGKKEYGALQAATTYQNAFDQLVYGSPQ